MERILHFIRTAQWLEICLAMKAVDTHDIEFNNGKISHRNRYATKRRVAGGIYSRLSLIIRFVQ